MAKKTEKDKYLAGWQRCQADFLNYKKNEAQRLISLVDYEKEAWAIELLKVIDQFEKAKEQIKEKDSVIEGFLQIEKYFKDFLKSQGVAEIEVGKMFDPLFQEAIETEESKEAEPGEVLKVIQKGYKYKDKIIRPARVKIAKGRDKPKK